MRVPQTAIVKGDARSYSIAAASVLAKVTRDRLMLEFDRQWPEYGFAEHKGYGTARHLAAIGGARPVPDSSPQLRAAESEGAELFYDTDKHRFIDRLKFITQIAANRVRSVRCVRSMIWYL